MKRQSLSTDHESFPAFTGKRESKARTNEQAHLVETRRQYYYNHVLKSHGIPAPKHIQEPSTSEREQRVQAFRQRNQVLRYFISLIQQEVVTSI